MTRTKRQLKERIYLDMPFLPVDPVLFGEPFGMDHPWHSAPSLRTGQEFSPRVHLMQGSDGCTACARGVSCRKVMRLTKNWKRATCSLCIRFGIQKDPEAKERVRALFKANKELREGANYRIGRAIGWWRICGASGLIPWYFDDFFIPADTKLSKEAIIDWR